MSLRSSQESGSIHVPVMAKEVLEYLNVQPGGIYLDGTIGTGGHAGHILAALKNSGQLLGIDRDDEALEICRQSLQAASLPLSLHHSSYDNFTDFLDKLGVDQVNGMFLDLGLSSLQLDSPRRGFSYQKSAPLDMRFDSSAGQTAAELIRSTSDSGLRDILRDFGQERRAGRIAKSIHRMDQVETSDDLVEAVRRSTPPSHRNRTLARVFQALRIAVNKELEKLKSFLDSFPAHLAPSGRIVIISYHSLEDRLVKHGFRECKQSGELNILTRKPIIPSAEEQKTNRRSRSAKLRAAERIS